MTEKTVVTIDDQISYLEAYCEMLKSQQNLLEIQIKFLKAGKDIHNNFQPMLNLFEKMNPFFQNTSK